MYRKEPLKMWFPRIRSPLNKLKTLHILDYYVGPHFPDGVDLVCFANDFI
jgi:hypothetical protein